MCKKIEESGSGREMNHCSETHAEMHHEQQGFEDNAVAYGGWFDKSTDTTMEDVGRARDTLTGW